MATTTPIQTQQDQILGALLAELMRGELSDRTIELVDTLDRNAVPEPLRDVVAYIHGMSMMPQLRYSIINDLLVELADGTSQLAKERGENAPPMF